jgi:hypothetical protein
MEDARAAVTNLIYTYAERIDLGDFDGLADLFANAEITAEGGAAWKGREKILALYVDGTRRYPDTGTPKTKHVTTNLLIEVDEDAGTATCRAYYTVFQAVPGSIALSPIIAGRYRDRFERVGGTWRFAARHMLVDLIGDLSQHLMMEIPS